MRPLEPFRRLHATIGKFGILFLAIVALFVATPQLIAGRGHVAILGVLTGAVLVAGLYAASPGLSSILLGLALAVGDFAVGRFAFAVDLRWLVLLQSLFWFGTLVYVVATILGVVFRSRSVTEETLGAALCVYLLIGMIAAFAFSVVEIALPGSFATPDGPAFTWADERSRAGEFLHLFVLSFGILSGSGFAAVTPATGFARNLASLEAMIGQIYLAVVIARLVGIQVAAKVEPTGGPE
ncbi:hypothetical protein OJF2_68240 [Aquisphaera giovannonii]|uniref:Uncharacterized protein n=1 Tax=Aquisphaera giovannonii TaxID=406548 RepID=A0A5B9WC83_9BACT|nr:hypothetical protein [Aquisphaera giovannonii]QEH38226.1 hypothetical protein OJF2_68240 [Aquisphaera giovannonii]